jgi:adenylate kinase family enzyme
VHLARLGQACCVNRVVIFGRGGAGKSTLARRLAARAQLPLIELDKELWNDQLKALPREQWAQRQTVLASSDQWIMDGDLGPYDAIEPRLRRADTVIILDLSLGRCAWRAVRRGRERRDFWTWTIRWRQDNRPHLLEAIAAHASQAKVIMLRTPAEVEAWLIRAHG